LDVKVSRPRVARLMKKAKIRSIVKRKFRVTTDSEHKYPIVENKLNRQFKVGKTATAWVSDIIARRPHTLKQLRAGYISP